MKKFLIIPILLILSGCGHYVTLHPIENSDIYRIKQGTEIKAGDKTLVNEKDGWFCSDFYIDEVMRARVQEK